MNLGFTRSSGGRVNALRRQMTRSFLIQLRVARGLLGETSIRQANTQWQGIV